MAAKPLAAATDSPAGAADKLKRRRATAQAKAAAKADNDSVFAAQAVVHHRREVQEPTGLERPAVVC